MANEKAILEIDEWLLSPAGRYVLAWQQQALDRYVADVFGFHALQVGGPALQSLRCNRMPHRWMLSDARQARIEAQLPAFRASSSVSLMVGPPADASASTDLPVSIFADYEALPFPQDCLDLVVLPHTLEIADDPHQALREVWRVLRPDGRVVVLGFNPSSWLGAWCAAASVADRTGLKAPAVPRDASLIGWLRLRDWLRLLGFEIECVEFGCYRLPLGVPAWIERLGWMDKLGARLWPVFGSVYMITAIKRVPALRIMGSPWKRRRRLLTRPAIVTQPSRSHCESVRTGQASDPSRC